jgi:hypothetical protein
LKVWCWFTFHFLTCVIYDTPSTSFVCCCKNRPWNLCKSSESSQLCTERPDIIGINLMQFLVYKLEVDLVAGTWVNNKETVIKELSSLFVICGMQKCIFSLNCLIHLDTAIWFESWHPICTEVSSNLYPDRW